MQWDWIIFSVCYGQYDLALRELRNVLESAFLFYRADYDINLRDKTLEEKAIELEKLKNNEKFGKTVLKKVALQIGSMCIMNYVYIRTQQYH